MFRNGLAFVVLAMVGFLLPVGWFAGVVEAKNDKVPSLQVRLSDVYGDKLSNLDFSLMRLNDATPLEVAVTDEEGIARYYRSLVPGEEYFIAGRLTKHDVDRGMLAGTGRDEVCFISDKIKVSADSRAVVDVVIDHRNFVQLMRVSDLTFDVLYVRCVDKDAMLFASFPYEPFDDDGLVYLIVPMNRHYLLMCGQNGVSWRESYLWFEIFATPGLALIT